MERGGGSVGTGASVVGGEVEGTEGYGADVEHVVESTKEARMPTQESPETNKSSPDSSEIVEAEQRPVQESEDPKNSMTVTEEEIIAGDKETRQPTQETSEAERPSLNASEIQRDKERPVQESENPKRPVQESEDPKNSMTATTVTEEEILTGGKEARQPTQETSEAEKLSVDVSEQENMKEKPVQESENPKNSMTVMTVTEEEILTGGKEARQPTQETSEAEKLSVDVSEQENMKEKPVQESENPKNSMTVTTVTEEEILTGGKEARQPTQETSEADKSSVKVSEQENMKEKPVQESENPKNSSTETAVMEEEIMAGGKEARHPTQETPEAEKSPPDSSEIEKEEQRPVQASEDPKSSVTVTTVKEEITTGDKETMQPTQATSEAEKSSVDVSELENMKEKPVQESENPKSSAADTPTMEAPVQESKEPTARKDELKDRPERSARQVFQEGDLKDSASSDVQTKSYKK